MVWGICQYIFTYTNPKNTTRFHTLTPFMKLSLVHTQVLSSTVLLKHFDVVPHVGQVAGKTHRFAKVHHVDTHSALVNRAPQQWGVLGGKSDTFLVCYLLIKNILHLYLNFLIQTLMLAMHRGG